MMTRKHFTASQDPETDEPFLVETIAAASYSPNRELSERVALWLHGEREAGRQPTTKQLQDKARALAVEKLEPNAGERVAVSDGLMRLRYLHAVVRLNGGNPDGTTYEQLMDLLALCEKPVSNFREWAEARWPQTGISQP